VLISILAPRRREIFSAFQAEILAVTEKRWTCCGNLRELIGMRFYALIDTAVVQKQNLALKLKGR
jgi:hypothetical protein